MHWERGGCFAWHYLYMSRENISICEGVRVKVSHLSHLSRKKFVSCLCQSIFEKAVSCISPTLFVIGRVVRQIISHPTFLLRRKRVVRGRQNQALGALRSQILKEYYYCEITSAWRLGLLFVLLKLHKMVPSYLFFLMETPTDQTKTYVVSYVAWQRRRVSVSWQLSSHTRGHPQPHTQPHTRGSSRGEGGSA